MLLIVLGLIALAARIASAAPGDDPELDPEELEELAERADVDQTDDDDELAVELALDMLDDVELIDVPEVPVVIDDRETAHVARRSPIGRVDLSLLWRRIEPAVSTQRDEVWLLGTWRL